MTIVVGSWNLGGIRPYDNLELKAWLQNTSSPDIVVLGFQEIVPLTSSGLAGGNKEMQKLWTDIILKSLNKPGNQDQYQLLRVSEMFGLVIFLLAKKSITTRILDLAISSFNGGVSGNKGSVSVRFKIGDTSFCFLNCHLDHG